MVPKIKKFIKKNKKMVIVGAAVLLFLIIFIIFYKSMFYSNSKSALYGVRLRDIKEHEFTSKDRTSVLNDVKKNDLVKDVSININGRLIKFIVTFEDGTNNDSMKTIFTDAYNLLDDKVKEYYDVSFYAILNDKYPLLGYKHKNNESISWDEI